MVNPQARPDPSRDHWYSPLEEDLLHLLLVDDDAGLRALLRTTFEVFDVDLREAHDAREAAAAIDQRHPDAIVLDVGLPGVDGLTFCARLKSDAETRDIPIVLLTGTMDVERAAAEAGADAL